jgi:peroxiredoxin Q/BCP
MRSGYAAGMKLKVGQKAPDFSLPDQTGAIHRLSDYRGRWVLVYFYPRDSTPGCTREACAIRDRFPDFADIDAVVIGISTDSVTSHGTFAAKLDLPFTVLADSGKQVVKRYGVWVKKKRYGREHMGTNRQSFLIDPGGTVAKVYEKVKPAEHATEVLEDLAKFMGH